MPYHNRINKIIIHPYNPVGKISIDLDVDKLAEEQRYSKKNRDY